MANTGNVFPGTGENVDRSGASDWVNPGNIVSDNATDATCASGASGCDYLVARNFNFSSIPDGSTINGITVRIEASEHSTGTEPLNAQLQDASAALTGSSKSATISGTGKTVYTYGSTSDVWGASPTAAMVKDPDFGVRFWFTTTHDIRVDYVTLAIEYTLPAVTGTGSGTITASAEASGTHGVTGTGSGEASATGSASGVHGVTGTTAGTILAEGSAAGVHGVVGSAAGDVAVVGEGAGEFAGPVEGEAAGTIVFSAEAAGTHGVTGEAAGTIQLSGEGIGIGGEDEPEAGGGGEEPGRKHAPLFRAPRREPVRAPAARVGRGRGTIALTARARGGVGVAAAGTGIVIMASAGAGAVGAAGRGSTSITIRAVGMGYAWPDSDDDELLALLEED